MIPNWSDPNPIFLDFETQSACDIKEAGGRAYVEHPSTRILILALCADDVFHVWIPDYIRVNTSSWDASALWPYQLKPIHEVRLYRGERLPECITAIATEERALVAHNAYGFDKAIWNRFLPYRQEWLDSLPLAKQSGRSGRLDQLGKSLLGVGKDHAKKLLPKLTTAKASLFSDGYSYPMIAAGDLQAFTRYAVGDVEILRRVWNTFDSINVEADVIDVHNTVNERGIAVDLPLLDVIEKLSAFSVKESIDEIKRLTKGLLHGDNIRSGPQVADWLGKFGVAITDDKGKPCLRKEIVQRFIDSPYVLEDNLSAAFEIPPITIDVMRLRMKALRITGAKVEKAKQRASADGRIRGLFSYHQAHTGRWSSNGVQVHNLPRPNNEIAGQIEHLLDTKSVVPYVPHIDLQQKDIRKLYDRIKAHLPTPKEGGTAVTVDDVCSMLIRPALKAKPGHTLVITDYAQVEARGVAYIADQENMLEAFRLGRDLYKEFAAKIFRVQLSEVTKDMRQIAKSAILGCVSEGTLVPTSNGMKEIQNVTINDLVWDGENYVRHNGIIYRGERECLHHQNIPTVTADHLVMSSKGWVEAREYITESTLSNPVVSSDDGRLFLNSNVTSKGKSESDILASVFAEQSRKWNVAISLLENLRDVMYVQKLDRGIPNPTDPHYQTINTEPVCLPELVQSCLDAQTNGIKSTPIMVAEGLRFIRNGLQTVLSFLPISSPYRDGITHDLKLIESTMMGVMFRVTCDSQPEVSKCPTVVRKTYDILDCGPNHRFQAGNMIVHNCGYGLGADKFRIYAANNGADLARAGVTAEECINAYRDEYTKIAGWKPKASDSFRVGGLWKDLDKAVKECVSTGVPQTAGKCRWLKDGSDLKCVLPSGRELYYPNARIEDIVPPYCYTMGLPLNPKATVVYDSERGPKSLYGGLLAENVVQAMCRDILACAMLELESIGMPVVAHIHDEIVCEVPVESARDSLTQMVRIMSTVPSWLQGFPLDAEGFTCERMNKSPFANGFKCSTKDLHNAS